MAVIDTKFRRLNRKVSSELTRVAIPFDKYYQFNAGRETRNSRKGMVFIVGAPRTGSTFLYQILSNYLNVGYLSNLANFFYHSLYTGVALHDKIYGNRPHNGYTSDNGRTKRWIDVNESGKFWYRWYPSGYEILENEKLDQKKLLQLKRTLISVQKGLGKPLLFKNQHFVQRITSLCKLFPESIFIHIKRKPLPTAKSIIRQRKRLNGDVNRWYSVKPANYNNLKDLGYREQVVGQIHGIDKMIEEQFSQMAAGRYMTVRYENLEQNWFNIVEGLFTMLNKEGQVSYRSGVEEPVFRSSTSYENNKETEQLKEIIEKVYG